MGGFPEPGKPHSWPGVGFQFDSDEFRSVSLGAFKSYFSGSAVACGRRECVHSQPRELSSSHTLPRGWTHRVSAETTGQTLSAGRRGDWNGHSQGPDSLALGRGGGGQLGPQHLRGQATARYRISSTGQGGDSGCTSWRAPASSLCPSSSQPEPESSGSVAPRFPEQDEDELHRTLGVERFEEILQEAGSRGGEEPGRSYGEEDFECEGTPQPWEGAPQT